MWWKPSRQGGTGHALYAMGFATKLLWEGYRYHINVQGQHHPSRVMEGLFDVVG